MADLLEVDKGTAVAASDAAKGAQQSESLTDDKGQKVSESPADKEEVTLGADGKPVPYDKDPKWKAARKAERFLQQMMKDHEVDDPDDLVYLLKSGKAVHGKLNLDELDDILEEVTTFREYKKVWAQQAEAKRREDEEPNEMADRLTRENEDLKRKLHLRDMDEVRQKDIKTFETTVAASIKELFPEVDHDEREYMKLVLGLGNSAIDANIDDKVALNKSIRGVLKKVEAHDQKIIKDYLEGKSKIPKVPRGEGDVITSEKKIGSLKEARVRLTEMLTPR